MRSGVPMCHSSSFGKTGGRRQVGGIAARRAGVGPRGDRRDLGVAQRRVVLELLDAHVALDVPGRHDAVGHARLDGPRPRPHVLVGHQRHRRVGAGPMARLARPLENRRDVLGVGDRHSAGEPARLLRSPPPRTVECAATIANASEANQPTEDFAFIVSSSVEASVPPLRSGRSWAPP